MNLITSHQQLNLHENIILRRTGHQVLASWINESVQTSLMFNKKGRFTRFLFHNSLPIPLQYFTTFLETGSCADDLTDMCSKDMALTLFGFPLMMMLGFSRNRNTLPFNILRYELFYRDKHPHVFKQEVSTLHNEQPVPLPMKRWTSKDSLTLLDLIPLICLLLATAGFEMLLALHSKFSLSAGDFCLTPPTHEAGRY